MFALWAAVQQPGLQFSAAPDSGLTVEAGGVPIVTGSGIQFYEVGWTRAYYSSSDGGVKVQKLSDDSSVLTFASDDGRAHGTETFTRTGTRLKLHYDLHWEGDQPVKIEATVGKIWAPALERGKLTADKVPARALNSYSYSGGNDTNARKFSPDASDFAFSAPLGTVEEQSTVPLTLFDARAGYAQEWAAGGQSWWLGALGMDVSKRQPVSFDVTWTIQPSASQPTAPVKSSLLSHDSASAFLPDTSIPPLIPKPRTNYLDWKHPVEFTNAFSFPIGAFDHLDTFEAGLARRFIVPKPTAKTKKIPIDGGLSQLGFTPGGYKLTVTDHSISVVGQGDEGLISGFERLAALIYTDHGKLWLPTGTLMDEPNTTWRGAHLFVGPDAIPFQNRLWTHVLRPLGFNKVVLECERTAWDSTPGIQTVQTMKKADLVRLFDMYRKMGVEPIPMVESYGHMEWLFENGKNLELAMNPKVPYAVDPRKPEAQAILTKLWDEVISTLNPKTVHFGLDEVYMRGVDSNPPLDTQLWKAQLALLGKIASSHGVGMMLWGDLGLAPGEAPDATNGDTAADAKARRDAIPKGSLIGDWHYLANGDPHTYTKTLQLWKDAGQVPIASAWYNPENIRGFFDDAGQLRVGTLQTTWAGSTSSEEDMIAAMPQFAALVLAADYGWSGRTEDIGALGYDFTAVFRKMYFGEPSPLQPLGGTDLGAPGQAFQIGQIVYGAPLDLAIQSQVAPVPSGGSAIELSTAAKGTTLALAMETLAPAVEDGDPVAELTVTLADGKTIVKKVCYGWQVRTATDKAPASLADRNEAGVWSYTIRLGEAPAELKSISLKPLNAYTGLRLRGLELVQ